MSNASNKKLVKVVYVGKKPVCTDNVARSNTQWKGFGDVQGVTAEQAAILFRYPDQWAAYDPKNPPSKETPVEESLKRIATVQSELAARPSVTSPGAKRLEDMDETELLIHAEYFYGAHLNATLSADEMRAEIEKLVQQAGQDAEELRNKDTLG